MAYSSRAVLPADIVGSAIITVLLLYIYIFLQKKSLFKTWQKTIITFLYCKETTSIYFKITKIGVINLQILKMLKTWQKIIYIFLYYKENIYFKITNIGVINLQILIVCTVQHLLYVTVCT